MDRDVAEPPADIGLGGFPILKAVRPGDVGQPGRRTPDNDLEFAKRHEQAVAMRAAGFTYKQIGKHLGISKQRAWKMVIDEVREARDETSETAAELRMIAHQRHETLLNRLWLRAMPPDTKALPDYGAIDRILRILQSDARIMGFEAPQKHQFDVTQFNASVSIVVDAVCRSIPDDYVPKVHEAVERALVSLRDQQQRREEDGEGAEGLDGVRRRELDALLTGMRSALSARVPQDRSVPFQIVARTRLQIRTVDNRVVPFVLRPLQMRYLAAKRLARMRGRPPRFLLLKYRRGGFTTIEQGLSYYMASRRRNVTVMTLAQDGETTSRIFRIALLMHERDPEAPGKKGSGNQYRLEFPGLNSLFYVGTAAGRGVGRGDTLSRVHWSEVAWSCPGYNQVTKQRDLLTGLTEAASHGEVVLETTPNGSELFRELYADAKQGRSEWTPIFLPWFEDELNCERVADEDELYAIMESLDEDELRLVTRHNLSPGQVSWRRRKRRELKALFAQEYPEDDETCWLVSGTPFFDPHALLKLRDYCTSPPMLDDLQLGQVPQGAQHMPGGYYVEWEAPQAGVAYCMGIDTSEGLPGCDPNGFGIMRKDNGKQVASLHGLFGVRDLADHVAMGVKRYGLVLFGVERENHGHAVIQKLLDLGLGKPHYRGGPMYHHSHAQAEAKEMAFAKAGWTTNAVTRPTLLEGLRDWMDAEGALERVMDRQFLSECLTFRKQYDGSFGADPGCHDDSVMKWGIANQMRLVPWRSSTALVIHASRFDRRRAPGREPAGGGAPRRFRGR